MAIKDRVSLTGKPFVAENSLIVDGVAFDIGTRVIKWWEPDGFGQYETNRSVVKTEDMATGKVVTKVIQGKRYYERKGGVDGISQVFFHHAGADRESPAIMRDVLHNQRGLSVQFAIEDDGRIYQFLDAVAAAKHAGTHNMISIGAECCLWPDAKKRPNYYSAENRARTGNLPHEIKTEVLQGAKMTVFCFPDPQVEACARWAAGLWFAIWKLATKPKQGGYNVGMTSTVPLNDMFTQPPRFPRDATGEIPRKVFKRHLEHVGLIGHLHCSPRKWDPAGFPWERVESLVRDHFWSFASNHSS